MSTVSQAETAASGHLLETISVQFFFFFTKLMCTCVTLTSIEMATNTGSIAKELDFQWIIF